MATCASTIRTAGWVLLALGGVCAVAGGYEVLSDRHLPHGWIRYQPPWAVPALIAAAVLVGLGSALLLTGLLWRRKP